MILLAIQSSFQLDTSHHLVTISPQLDRVVPSSDHCCTETVLPSSDHYRIDTVSPSGGYCFTDTVSPPIDHYSINIVVPSSDHCYLRQYCHLVIITALRK